MSNHAPTTDEIREYVAYGDWGTEEYPVEEFDRWLAKHDAEVERTAAAIALEQAADKFAAEDTDEWGYWQDYEGWSTDPSQPLRKLAAEYRREEA